MEGEKHKNHCLRPRQQCPPPSTYNRPGRRPHAAPQATEATGCLKVQRFQGVSPQGRLLDTRSGGWGNSLQGHSSRSRPPTTLLSFSHRPLAAVPVTHHTAMPLASPPAASRQGHRQPELPTVCYRRSTGPPAAAAPSPPAFGTAA